MPLPYSKANECPLCGIPSQQNNNEFVCANGHVWRVCYAHEVPVKVVTSLTNKDTSNIYFGNKCCCHLDVLQNNQHLDPSIKMNMVVPSNDIPAPSVADTIRDSILQMLGLRPALSLLAASKPKNPTPKYPPNNISERAKSLWPEFCKKYSSKWKDRTETPEKWAIAVAIFKNYCVKRNVAPFEKTPTDTESVDYMANRIRVARTKALSASNKLAAALIKNKFAKHVYKETLVTVDTKRAGFYRILTTRKIKSDLDLKSQEFRNWLKANKFDAKNGTFVRAINGLCNLVVEYDNDQQCLLLNTKYTFPSPLVAMALSVSQDDVKTKKEEVTKKLSQLFKKIMKEPPKEAATDGKDK